MGRPLREVGNEGNPNKVGVFNQSVRIGSALKLGASTVGSFAVVNNEIVLPDGMKALVVIFALATVGTSAGQKTPVLGGSPSAGEVGITPTGDIVFNATDAVTAAEVTYTVSEGDVVDFSSIVPASGNVLLGATDSARLLLSATVDGNSRTVVARGSAPGVGEVSVGALGGLIQFNAADDGLVAELSYVQFPQGTSVGDRLEGDVDF